MITRYSARLAKDADNEQLLLFNRLCPIEGKLTINTERDPNYFALNKLQGDPWFVGVVEDLNKCRIVGSASIAVQEVFIDGKKTLSLYAGDLKISPDARFGNALRQLYDLLWGKARILGIQVGHTSIIEGNRAARVLTKGHFGMPKYLPIGNVQVCAVDFQLPEMPIEGYKVDQLTDTKIPEIVSMLNRFNSRFNFSPIWTEIKFKQYLNKCPGLSLNNFYVAKKDNKIKGILAAWDQSLFQRTRIFSSPWSVAIDQDIYPVNNLGTPANMLSEGGILNQIYWTHLAIEDDQPEILNALLSKVYNLYRSKGYHFITFGLPENHPLLEALDGFSYMSFRTVVFALTESGSKWESYDFSHSPIFHEISHV